MEGAASVAAGRGRSLVDAARGADAKARELAGVRAHRLAELRASFGDERILIAG